MTAGWLHRPIATDTSTLRYRVNNFTPHIVDIRPEDEPTSAQRDQRLAAAMERYARSIGDHTWTPYRTEQAVAAVDLTPAHQGEVVADLGRSLRSLPMFRSPRPWEDRWEADTMAAYAQDRGIRVYSAGFRVSPDCVGHSQFWAAYDAASDALPEIKEAAAAFGVVVLVGKVETAPREGGRLLDTHGHLIVTGTAAAVWRFRHWLRKTYSTGWVGSRPREPWALSEYVEKSACVGDWEAEWAYKFACLLRERRVVRWTRHYGDFQSFRRERKGQKLQDGKDKYCRRQGAPRDGETIIRIGTCRAADGRLRPCLFVKGYRGDLASLTAKYDLDHAFAWAADYAMSQSTVILQSKSTTSDQHVNSQQSGHGPPDPAPDLTFPEVPF